MSSQLEQFFLVGLMLLATVENVQTLKCYTCSTDRRTDSTGCKENLVTCSESDAVCSKHFFKYAETVRKSCSTSEACAVKTKECEGGDSCVHYCCTGDMCNAGAHFSLHYSFPVLLMTAINVNC